MALRLKTSEPITLKIDKLGRIVIPQAVRESLGFMPGTTLKLVQQDDKAICLEAVKETPQIIYKNGWPVVTGPGWGGGETDIVKIIKQDREERDFKVAGVSRKKS